MLKFHANQSRISSAEYVALMFSKNSRPSVPAGRQTAAIAQETELSGFLPKAATPGL
jgi:hypothetical protein